jgi:hypothetical protein
VGRARYSEIKPGELLEIKILFGREGWESRVEYVVRVLAVGGVWDEGRASLTLPRLKPVGSSPLEVS